MFDTNIFNGIRDGRIDISSFDKRHHYYTTHIQYDEVCNTQDPSRRAALKTLFKYAACVPTETAVVGTSRLDMCKIPDDDHYDRLLNELDRLERKDNNQEDALIADTAIKKGHILVTNDRSLRKVASKMGGKVKSLDEFLRIMRD